MPNSATPLTFAASLIWHAEDSRLSIEFGAAHFAKGGFVELTAPEQSMASNYLSVAPTIMF